jgi:hypothetical protein
VFCRKDRSSQSVHLASDTTYNILLHKFVYKANSTTRPNYFKQAMVLCHGISPSVCPFVFVFMKTKFKSQLLTITPPDGRNKRHWNETFG